MPARAISTAKPAGGTDHTVDRRTLHEQLADALRQMIIDGDLAPGERLQEVELSTRFGVSRTPFREALKVLSFEGLITLTPNRGARVSALKPEEVAEAFPVMGALEALAGELACANATDGELGELGRLHDDLIRHTAERDLAAYYAANQDFHALVLKAARNETLARAYNQLAGRVSRARFRANMTDKRWAQAMREHDELIAALRARDGRRAFQILRAHVDTKFATVTDALTDR